MAPDEALIVAKGNSYLGILPRMANRHGLIAGATGTGKTVTLQVLAEKCSEIGIPIFMADVKGDLSGLSQTGTPSAKLTERLQRIGLVDHQFHSFPVSFWDVYGENGHPVRATISDMGPLLLARILNLNETQSGVLNIVFRIADDNGLLLLDLKDLRAMLEFSANNAKLFKTQYGNISAASVGAIQRGLLSLEEQGGSSFFGEPALDLDDMMQTDQSGRGMINVLSADRLMQAPKIYSTFLLWLLSELYERMPEVGDVDKPKFIFFFDEAHLLFTDTPKALLEKIELVVRLVRSKGVGVYFVTQNPLDIPDTVLGQLGNRVQHALRAYTPRDQKAVKAAAETFRSNPDLDVATAITELGVGEALVSFLDGKGAPGIVNRAMIVPPKSQIGAIRSEQRQQIVQGSLLYGHYEKSIDRESAYELLKRRTEQFRPPEEAPRYEEQPAPEQIPSRPRSRGREPQTVLEAMATSAARAVGSTLGRQIIRGVLGSIFGGRR